MILGFRIRELEEQIRALEEERKREEEERRREEEQRAKVLCWTNKHKFIVDFLHQLLGKLTYFITS